jgi:hypothetical protein
MPSIVFSDPWDTVTGGIDNANVARVTSPVYEGAGALRLQPTASVAYWTETSVGADPAILVYRIFVSFPALPAIDLDILRGNIDGVTEGGIAFDTSESKFATSLDGTLAAAGGPVIEIDEWYRLDCKVDASTGTWTVDGQVALGEAAGTVLAQRSGAFAASTFPDYRLGDSGSSGTYTAYLDEFDVSHTAADYPLGGSAPIPRPQDLSRFPKQVLRSPTPVRY